ncbi:MAG: glycosyltransferase [Chitinophagaceae bacterium]|nr:glycosyltransferase [Chitinophagaceae bacterium]
MSAFTRQQRQKTGASIFYYSRKNILAAAQRNWSKVLFYSVVVLLKRTWLLFMGGKQPTTFAEQRGLFPQLFKTTSSLQQLCGLHIGKPLSLYPQLPISSLKNYLFEFPGAERPLISIIIPVYNHCAYTFNCLLSLHNHILHHKVEIIIVNDCSTDETADILEQIKGITVLNNGSNLGYLRSCNKGAEEAKGKFLLLLNNDVQAINDFITPLLQVFDTYKDAGAAGGKLIYPSGLLQEAGVLLFKDAHAMNIGRMDHPEFWMYNFVREVDYCSAALLMVRKEDWTAVNGFDTRYTPAYFEDSDLCLSLKNQFNKKTYYTPFASVIHFEGISSGTDETKGIKQYQQLNKNAFVQKWARQLQQKPVFNADLLVKHVYENTLSVKKKVLLFYPHIPEFDKDSGANRMKHILQILCAMADVYLYVDSYYNNYESVYAKELQQWGCRIIYRHDAASNETFAVEEVLKHSFDHIWLTGFHLAEKYFDKVKATNSHIIYDTVDLHYLRFAREEQLNNQPSKRSQEIKTKELDFIRRAAITYVVSEVERALLKELQIGNVHILSNIHIPVQDQGLPFQERKDLLFIGGFHHQPNIDAVKWLKQEIMPLVWQKDASITVHIVGSSPTDEIKNMQQNNFIIHGFVKDVTPYFQSSKLFVCPLRYGAGVKGKIGQALEYHLPVVTTAVGSEGMGMQHGIHCWQAEDAHHFADAILYLYNNESDWNHIHSHAQEALKKFSPQTAAEELQKLV